MENKIRIGSLWTAKTKSGEEFFSGNFGSMARLLVFKNNYKQGDNDPDFTIYIVPRERDSQTDDDASTGSRPAPQAPSRPPATATPASPDAWGRRGH